MKKIKLILFAFLFTTNISAQIVNNSEVKNSIDGNVILAELSTSNKDDDLTILRNLYENSNFEYESNTKYIDEFENSHYLYQQTYKKLRVYGAGYTFHKSKKGNSFLNGVYINPEKINLTSIKFNKNEAEQLLSKYLYSLNIEVKNIKFESNELIICNKLADTKSKYNYAYIVNTNIPTHAIIFINASNGEILGEESIACTVNAPGTGQTRYSGTRNIITDVPVGNSNYRLFQERSGTNIHVRNMFNEINFQNFGNAIDFWDNDNNWTNAEHGNDNVALDIHWAMESILDYWRLERGRNSYDNNFAQINCYAHVNFPAFIGQNNAVWLGGNQRVMQFADGGTWNPVVSLDVCGHEFGHGVNQFTSQLPGTDSEGGALNEGFSDIWGACIEAYAAPNKQRWLIGEEVTIPQFALRTMINPNDLGDPDTYLGTNWSFQGQRHNNSTVLSHWFYLLTEGGNGTNDIGNNFNVNGLGINVAARIAQLTQLSLPIGAGNYINARATSVQITRQEYGIGSCEEIAVTNAWFAVGVGAEYISQANISGVDAICSNSSKTYKLNGVVPCNTTASWNLINNTIGASLSSTFGSTTTIFVPNAVQNAILTLTASITGTSISISKQIFIGSPFFGATYNNGTGTANGNPVIFIPGQEGNPNYYNNICIGYGFPNLYIDGQPYGANNVNWSVPNGYATNAFSIQQQNDNRVYFSWNYGGFNNPPGYVKGTINNACGSMSQIFAFKQINCGTQGGDPCSIAKDINYFTITPNPANDIINIGIYNKPAPIYCNKYNALNTPNGIIFSAVNIYDRLGILVKSYRTKDAKKATIQIDNLIAGSYIVEIIQNDYSEKQQIIVQ